MSLQAEAELAPSVATAMEKEAAARRDTVPLATKLDDELEHEGEREMSRLAKKQQQLLESLDLQVRAAGRMDGWTDGRVG